MKTIARLAPLLSCALLATPAAAWGPEGHTIIARVAFSRLNAKATGNLKWMTTVGIPALNAATEGCQIDPANPLGAVDPADPAHSNIANWADCYRNKHRETADWHFDDIPNGQHPATLSSPDPWCKADGCVSTAFASNVKALAVGPSAKQSPADTARAFVYVVHFLGDLHQPLHDSDNGDRGGNQVSVSTAGAFATGSGLEAKNLHGLWDTPLVQVAFGKDLDTATAALAAETKTPPAQWTAKTSTVNDIIGSSRTWIADGHAFSKNAYGYLSPPPTQPGAATAAVDKHYVDTQSVVVQGQIQRAAVRLTAVLNTALLWKTPTN